MKNIVIKVLRVFFKSVRDMINRLDVLEKTCDQLSEENLKLHSRILELEKELAKEIRSNTTLRNTLLSKPKYDKDKNNGKVMDYINRMFGGKS